MILTLKNKMALTLAVVATLIGLSFAFAPNISAQIDIGKEACDLAGTEECTTGGDGTEGAQTTIRNIAGDIIDILSIIVAAAAVIFIIIGGVKYVTSNGNQEKVTAAKTTILYAVIGLVIVLLAQTILGFVIDGASSIETAGE